MARDDLEHPDITKVRDKGYVEQREIYGTDLLGNEVFMDEEIYILGNDEFVGAHNLSEDARQILDYIGAMKLDAKD